MKTPLGKDVYSLAKERIRYIFESFPKVYLSFSAGKDSSAMLHITADIARKMERRFGLLLIDLEAQYDATVRHALQCFSMYSDVCEPYWVALPLSLRNAVSTFQPKWTCWGNGDQWVRNPPEFAITDHGFFPFFRYGMEFEEFVEDFSSWYAEGELTACLVGIRAQESLNRFRAISSSRKSRFMDKKWTTFKGGSVFNAYPVYDWATEDIWTFFGKTGLPHNTLYDKMWRAGISINEQRICQPYGDDQRKGLDLFHQIEPETWERVLARVAGANYGALYAKTAGNVLGRIKVKKPEGMTWRQYSELLMAGMPEESRTHYSNKIAVFIKWWMDRGYPEGIPDEADKKEEAAKSVPSWRRICRALLKNDWWCKSLSFSMHKSTGYENYNKVMKKRRRSWGF